MSKVFFDRVRYTSEAMTSAISNYSTLIQNGQGVQQDAIRNNPHVLYIHITHLIASRAYRKDRETTDARVWAEINSEVEGLLHHVLKSAPDGLKCAALLLKAWLNAKLASVNNDNWQYIEIQKDLLSQAREYERMSDETVSNGIVHHLSAQMQLRNSIHPSEKELIGLDKVKSWMEIAAEKGVDYEAFCFQKILVRSTRALLKRRETDLPQNLYPISLADCSLQEITDNRFCYDRTIQLDSHPSLVGNLVKERTLRSLSFSHYNIALFSLHSLFLESAMMYMQQITYTLNAGRPEPHNTLEFIFQVVPSDDIETKKLKELWISLFSRNYDSLRCQLFNAIFQYNRYALKLDRLELRNVALAQLIKIDENVSRRDTVIQTDDNESYAEQQHENTNDDQSKINEIVETLLPLLIKIAATNMSQKKTTKLEKHNEKEVVDDNDLSQCTITCFDIIIDAVGMREKIQRMLAIQPNDNINVQHVKQALFYRIGTATISDDSRIFADYQLYANLMELVQRNIGVSMYTPSHSWLCLAKLEYQAAKHLALKLRYQGPHLGNRTLVELQESEWRLRQVVNTTIRYLLTSDVDKHELFSMFERVSITKSKGNSKLTILDYLRVNARLDDGDAFIRFNHKTMPMDLVGDIQDNQFKYLLHYYTGLILFSKGCYRTGTLVMANAYAVDNPMPLVERLFKNKSISQFLKLTKQACNNYCSRKDSKLSLFRAGLREHKQSRREYVQKNILPALNELIKNKQLDYQEKIKAFTDKLLPQFLLLSGFELNAAQRNKIGGNCKYVCSLVQRMIELSVEYLDMHATVIAEAQASAESELSSMHHSQPAQNLIKDLSLGITAVKEFHVKKRSGSIRNRDKLITACTPYAAAALAYLRDDRDSSESFSDSLASTRITREQIVPEQVSPFPGLTYSQDESSDGDDIFDSQEIDESFSGDEETFNQSEHTDSNQTPGLRRAL